MRPVRTVLAMSLVLFVSGSESPPSRNIAHTVPVIVPLKLDSEQTELMNAVKPEHQFYVLKVGEREVAGIEIDGAGNLASLVVLDKKRNRMVSLEAKEGVFPAAMSVSTDPAIFGQKGYLSGTTLCDDDLDGLPDRRFEWNNGRLVDRSVVKRIEWKDDLKRTTDLPRSLVPPPPERKVPTPAPPAER